MHTLKYCISCGQRLHIWQCHGYNLEQSCSQALRTCFALFTLQPQEVLISLTDRSVLLPSLWTNWMLIISNCLSEKQETDINLEFILARSFFAFFRALCLSSPSFTLSEDTELSVTMSTMYFFKERCS